MSSEKSNKANKTDDRALLTTIRSKQALKQPGKNAQLDQAEQLTHQPWRVVIGFAISGKAMWR